MGSYPDTDNDPRFLFTMLTTGSVANPHGLFSLMLFVSLFYFLVKNIFFLRFHSVKALIAHLFC